MRPIAALLLLVAAAAVATGTWATIAVDGRDADPELVLPHFDLTMPTKNAWPELVGKSTAEAKAAVEADLPNGRVFLVPQGSMMTMDFRTDRVRIMYDPDTQLVVSPPRVG